MIGAGYGFVNHLIAEVTRQAGLTLEMGCGASQYRSAIRGRYVPTDVTLASYRADMPRDVAVLCSGDALAFRDGCFDVVFSVGSLQYIPDLRGAIAESCRVLRPLGKVLVVTNGWRTLRRLHDDEPTGHCHVYSAFTLERLYRAQGMRTRFLDAEPPATAWKRLLARIRPVRYLRRRFGLWVILLAERAC